MPTTSTTSHTANGVLAMRVAREFQSPETARRLETVQEDALAKFLETAPRDAQAVELSEWQKKAVAEGLRAADQGETVPHQDVMRWVRSWGSENELPKPRCK